MNIMSRTITGIVLILVGVALNLIPLFVEDTQFTLIYGSPLLIIGIFILFNKKEDIIEERKDLNKNKAKK